MKLYALILISLLLLVIGPAYGAEKESVEENTKKTLLNVAKWQAGVVTPQGPLPDKPPEQVQEEVVRLDDLIQEALRNNPEIRAVRHRWEAATKRPSQVSTLPDPTVGLMYWNAGNPVPGTSVGSNMMSFVEPQFMQEIPFPGKLRLRGEMAIKEADSAAQDFRMNELKVISQLKEAYFDLLFTIKSLEILAKNRDLLGRTSKIAEARYAVGKGTQADVLRSQVEVSLLIDRMMVLEQKRESQKARLNSLLNRPPSAGLGRPEFTKETPFNYTLEQLVASAEKNNPSLRARALMIDRNAVALNLAKREYLPDFSVSVGYMYFGRFQEMYDVRFNVKVPLYFWRKQRLGVEEAAAGLAESKQKFRATAQDLFFKIKDNYLIAKTAERLADLYDKGIIPQSAASIEAALSGYEVGTVDFPGLIDSFTIMLNYEVEFHRQVVEREKALARLEELTATRFIK